MLFNVLGPLWCWKRPAWRVVHLATLGSTVLIMALRGVCPLTELENHFLARSDPSASHAGGFIARFLERIVYWEVTPGALGAATGLWLVLWLALYVRLWRRERS